MQSDVSAAAISNPPRRVSVPNSLTYDFVSDVVVYRVERVQSYLGKSRDAYAKRYLSRDIWFKVLLNINTNGHCGKYIATITSLGRGGRLDDARDSAHLHLIREEMQARVLEAIVEAGKYGQWVTLSILPSGVRLNRIDQCSRIAGDVFQHRIVTGDLLRRFGFLAPDGERVIVTDLLSDGLDGSGDKMIEGRPQVVDRLVRENLNNVTCVNHLKAVDVARSIVIYLTPEGQWISRLELLDDASQVAQVLTCPAELEFEPRWCRERVCCRHERKSANPEGRGDSLPWAQGLRYSAGSRDQAGQEVTGSQPKEVALRKRILSSNCRSPSPDHRGTASARSWRSGCDVLRPAHRPGEVCARPGTCPRAAGRR